MRAAGKSRSSGGCPSVVYRLEPSVGCTIGVFFEMGECRLIAVDPGGVPIAGRTLGISPASVGRSVAEGIVEVTGREVRNLLTDLGLSPGKVLAVGVAAPGMVDTRRGGWLHGLRLSGIEHAPLGRLLESELGVPVLVEDQARCVAHAAAARIGPGEAGNLLLIYLGSGVGAGMILNGELYQGHRGLAGDIGHFVVEENGERCRCRKAGCLETVASVPALLRRLQRRLDEGVLSSLQGPPPDGSKGLALERIREAAGSGDRLALSTMTEIGHAIGEACGKAIMLFDPRSVCIGGPVAMLGEYFREALWDRVEQQVIPEMLRDLRLDYMAAPCADEALGTALLASRWVGSGADHQIAERVLDSGEMKG